MDMSIKDYSEEKEYSHYNGVPSMYGKIVDKQCKEQPMYCWPGDPEDGKMMAEHRNVQLGPDGG